jgi:hypothetical protein
LIKDIRNLEKVKVDFRFTSKRAWKLDQPAKKIVGGEVLVCKNIASSASQNASKKQETQAKSEKQKP